MLVQVIIILLMVPLSDLVIVPDNCVKHVNHVVVPAKRIMAEICIQKDLSLHTFRLSRIDIQLCTGLIFILLSTVEVIQCMIHELQDMCIEKLKGSALHHCFHKVTQYMAGLFIRRDLSAAPFLM